MRHHVDSPYLVPFDGTFSLLELDDDRLLIIDYSAGGASIDGVVFGFEALTES